MKRTIKQKRRAHARVVRCAIRYIHEERDDSPRLYMGKQLHDAMQRLGKAVDALAEAK